MADRDDELDENTRIKRDTQVRGSLGIPPSGESEEESEEGSRDRDRDRAMPELDLDRMRNQSDLDEDDRMSER